MNILGTGTAVPENPLDQQAVAEVVAAASGLTGRQTRTILALFRRAGVSARHSVLLEDGAPGRAFYEGRDGTPGTAERMDLYERLAGPLAEKACRRALEDASLPPAGTTHLVTASCTGFAAPGWDLHLIEKLPLDRTVQRTHLGFMGCHAALNAIRVAAAITGADPLARVLVCCTELCTLHLRPYRDRGQASCTALFGDGAGALVMGSSGEGWRVAANGSRILPGTSQAMGWRVGDHGFEIELSARVPGLVGEVLGATVDEWLEGLGRSRQEIESWAIHPGGPRILEAATEALGIPTEAVEVSREVLRDYGNLSSATLVFVLERLIRREAPRPCVALAFGPGLTIEAALFE